MALKYGEKIEINKSNECEDLRRSILELMNQIPEKIEGITETRRLKWINTQMRNLVNEKKPVLNDKAAASSRKRANEYYKKNKEEILQKIEDRRRRIREISRSDVS